MDFVTKANVKALEVASGIAVGGALTGEPTGMVAGYNFAHALTGATNLEGILRTEMRPIKGIKNLASSSPIGKSAKFKKKMSNANQAYNNLREEKGWNDDKMLQETEKALNIKDPSKIEDDNLRAYAETIQDLRGEYEGKYQAPDDMVMRTVDYNQENKNQDWQLPPKEYKKAKGQDKPKTRPINRPNPQNNSNQEENGENKRGNSKRTSNRNKKGNQNKKGKNKSKK